MEDIERFYRRFQITTLFSRRPYLTSKYYLCIFQMRRRVKEQLKKIGGMEFYDVNFSYIENETFNEEYLSVPEQGGGKLIPEGMGKPGHIYQFLMASPE